MCLATQALKNLCHASRQPFASGVYTGEYTLLISSCLQSSSNCSFLNSVPLSVKILELPPKMQYMWVLYASQMVSADLSGIGMAIVYPVSMSIHVKINLFLLEVTGDIGPTKSIQMSCISMSGVLKCPKSAELFP